MPRTRKPKAAKPATPVIHTAMDRQVELQTSLDRFLPGNLPENHFRDLLRAAWSLGSRMREGDIELLLDHIQGAIKARLDYEPPLPIGPLLHRLYGPPFDRDAWERALSWTAAALTAEWGYREGFVGPPAFNMFRYDFETQQHWGAPKVPGAMAVSAAPNNPWVAELGMAMDAIFDPETPWTSCEFCSTTEKYKDLSVITDAIAAADAAIGYSPNDGAPPAWRLSGVVSAVGTSEHYTKGTEKIREHCYHVVHGSTQEAQLKCARDQIVKPCGEWCNAMTATLDSMNWAVEFATALEKRAQELVMAGKIKAEEIAFLYAAAAERMIKEARDFESVHIAHSVSHLTMDGHAPRPVRH